MSSINDSETFDLCFFFLTQFFGRKSFIDTVSQDFYPLIYFVDVVKDGGKITSTEFEAHLYQFAVGIIQSCNTATVFGPPATSSC